MISCKILLTKTSDIVKRNYDTVSQQEIIFLRFGCHIPG